MRLEKWIWKETAEVLGVIGIIAGMVFLGFEMRQNTLAIRATAIQTAAVLTRENMYWVAGDPELSRIAVLSMNSSSELDPVEGLRAAYIFRTFWVGMQANYRQWTLGILPDEEWAYYRRTLCAIYGIPTYNARWQAERQIYIPEFVVVVEQCDPPADDGRLPITPIYENTLDSPGGVDGTSE